MHHLKGIGVALVTPFNHDNTIDFQSLSKLIDFNITNGVHYIVVLGTTAETATLSAEEKQQIIQHVVSYTNKRVPLVLGVGGNNTQEIVQTIETIDLTPFEAILSVSPYYNKPTQEGVYQHFKAIANATNTPIILYNVPSRTGGAGIQPETALRLAKEFPSIIAMKEATGDMGIAMEYLRNKPDNFLVLSGDDAFALPLIYLGGDGVISVIGEALPKEFSQMTNKALEGDIEEANQLHFKCLRMIELIFEEGNPAGIKELLFQRGIISTPNVRLPLVKASKELAAKIQIELTHF